MQSEKTIVILTGAGISAESGLQTFRASDGLWCDHRVEDVATPEAFDRNPALVHRFYNMRRAQLKEVEPNPAHKALARLAAEWPGELLLVTQNVDDLHERADEGVTPKGKYELLHMHGELKKIRCTESNRVYDWQDDLDMTSICDCCGETATLRPHIVWFGEMPIGMDRIYDALRRCDLFLSIGTSGNVYPAAGFVFEVRRMGHAHTVEINLEPSAGENYFAEKIYGPAGETLPGYIEKILTQGL